MEQEVRQELERLHNCILWPIIEAEVKRIAKMYDVDWDDMGLGDLVEDGSIDEAMHTRLKQVVEHFGQQPIETEYWMEVLDAIVEGDKDGHNS